ncbi:MAG: calcium/sodium antiporter [Woeseiaceae bacterium]|nr:calcium/sodium antiporter [Woeseiaceae bacterium]
MLGNLVEVIAGLALLIWGANRFVLGASATARNLGVSSLLIGLTIVAFATSAPEVLVSVFAGLRGESDLAVGNAIGSNIANIGLVLGVVAFIRPIELKSTTLAREMPALLAVSLLTVSLFFDTYLSRADGLLLLASLVVVTFWLTRLSMRSAAQDPMRVEFEAEIPADIRMPTAIAWLIVGLAALLFGAQLLVDGSVAIARAFGISEIVIGITLVAIGTSLPEFAVTVVSALKREYDIAIGNIVGSNIFNLLAVIGVAAVIEPASLHPSVLSLHIFVMVAFTLALFAITYETRGKGRIKRIEGVVLVTSYVTYIAYIVMQNV